MSSTAIHRAKQFVLVGVTVSVALVLSACSSSSAGSTSATASGRSSSALSAKVAAAEKAPASLPVPSASMPDLSSLSGKTVYFIPITQQAPQFAVTEGTLKTALGKVGVNLQVCNGNATPTGVTSCVTQATSAGAGAIVTDAIQYGLAGNAFDEAQKAGIPVINTDLLADAAHPAASKLGYIEAQTKSSLVALADWITVDSGGKGTVLINESTDNPASATFVNAGVKEFKAKCPGCSVTVNKISSANFNLIPSSTSSALLKTPGVGYMISEYDQYVQPTQSGVQQAGKSASVKGLSGATSLTGLQMIQKKNFLYAAVAQAVAYQGWVDADAALRMMTGTSGSKLPTYTVPYRLFTRDNIGDITVTSSAQASGEWFGSPSYTKRFLKLWGVS